MKILIAEDDFTSRAVLSGILNRLGHNVIEVANGAEAWEVMQRPDAPLLLILDWMMPEMDGLEVVRLTRARQTNRQPYIIMVTAKGERADIVAGLDAGANDCLRKPFDANELRACVEVGRRMIEMEVKLSEKIRDLEEAIEHIKTLKGIIPICCNCKKVRNDKGFWQQVEVYVSNHTGAEFSHSLCVDCLQELYPDDAESILENEGK
jgi:sigma-B regulation protein RsbU (phosphoserine phosphatase)